jgi:hypothetical protein
LSAMTAPPPGHRPGECVDPGRRKGCA